MITGPGTALPAPVVAYLIETLGGEGYPVDKWAANAGITSTDVKHDFTCTVGQTTAFLREVVRAMPDSPIGLDVGARPLLQSFGMVGVAMQTASDVATTLGIGLHFHRVAGSIVDFDLHEGPDTDSVSLVLLPRSADREILPFLCEETMLSSLALLRSALGEDRYAPRRIELGYPAPSYAGEYDEHFRCPVIFDADCNRVVMGREVLARRLPRREPDVHAAALTVCRRLLGESAQPGRIDYPWAVEQLLRADLRRATTMAGVARQLGTTERTLRRNLAAAGTTFRELYVAVRRDTAVQLIRDTDMPIGLVSREVGFSDVRDFRRAFVGWTGVTPLEERERGADGGR